MRMRRTNRRDVDRRSSHQNRPNILGAAQRAINQSAGLCGCSMVVAGSVDCQSLDHVEVWTGNLGEDFDDVSLEFDESCEWISDTLEYSCYDGTDEYGVTLTVSGTDAGDVTLVLARTSGTNCDEFSATWVNVHPWLPLAANEMRLQSGYSTPPGVKLPCMVCLKPPVSTVDVPCMEDWYHWSDGIIATEAQRVAFGLPDYVAQGDAETTHRVYSDTRVPEFIAVSGLEWSGATGATYASEFQSWANGLGPIIMRNLNSTTWTGSKCEEFTGYALSINLTFEPCFTTLTTNDNPNLTSSCETVPLAYKRLGYLLVQANYAGTCSGSNAAHDSWVYMVVSPGDSSLKYLEQQTATMVRCGRNDMGWFDTSGQQSTAFFDSAAESVELIPQI